MKCLVFLLVGLFLIAGPAAAQTRELVMANINPPNHGTTLAGDQFAEKVGELTQGKVKVIHHHSGTLGNERQEAQQLLLGTLDVSAITSAPLSTVVPELSALQLPYLFRDYQHVYKVLDESDVVRGYYDEVLFKRGFKLLGFFASGYRGIYGSLPINSVADIKGKKIRTMEDKVIVSTFKALGMLPTAIAMAEVATSLQTGVVEFAEGGVNTFYHLKYYDIVKNVADVRHIHNVICLVMSKISWAKQDAATQKALLEAGKFAEKFNRKFILDEDRDFQDQIKAKGVKITKPDATPFREATKSVYDEYFATPAGKDAKKVVDYIVSVK